MRLSLLPLCALLVLSGCLDTKPPLHDRVASRLPFAAARLDPIDELPDATALPTDAQQRLHWQRTFFHGDLSALDDHLNAAHRAYVRKEELRNGLDHFADWLEATGMAGLDRCTIWLKEKPASYAAHYVCAMVWHHGAWLARSHERADKVTPIRFALMRERLAQSNQLLEKAEGLDEKPVEAMTLHARNLHLLGNHSRALALLKEAELHLQHYAPLHDARLMFAMPEWDGDPASADAAFAAAKAAGLDQVSLLDLTDSYLARPQRDSVPGAERLYWERAIAEQPTRFRMQARVMYEARTENWQGVIAAADAQLAAYPDSPRVMMERAEAHAKTGNVPAALADYRQAAALGNDHALQTLIRAHLTGALGIAPKQWESLDRICRYGASLALPSGSNCMASIFWEGDKIGGPFRSDPAQAYAWHLMAARGGYHNSQFDLGWLLASGRAPNLAAEQARDEGIFWLHRAAEQNHEHARKRLEELGEPRDEEIGGRYAAAREWLEIALKVVVRIIGA